MTKFGNLWAIGYDDMARADEVRKEITGVGSKHFLIVADLAVVVRQHDGSFTIDRKPFPAVPNILGCTAVGFLVGLVVAAPLTGATIGALVGGTGTAAQAATGIGDDFIREVKGLMKPGTSVLFVFDVAGEKDVILNAIRGMGGTVLKTNVDLEWAKLVQSTLAATSAESVEKPVI